MNGPASTTRRPPRDGVVAEALVAACAALWPAPLRAQPVAPRPVHLRVEGCAPRVGRSVRDTLARPERRRVELLATPSPDAPVALVRCEGARVHLEVTAPARPPQRATLAGVAPDDLREALLTMLDEAPPPPPQAALVVVAPEAPSAPRPSPAASPASTPTIAPAATSRREDGARGSWAALAQGTVRVGPGVQPVFAGAALGAAWRAASGWSLRAEGTLERAEVAAEQVGGVSITLAGAGVAVAHSFELTPRVRLEASLGLRGGAALVTELGARSRRATLPWAATSLGGGVTVAMTRQVRARAGVELGAAFLTAEATMDDETAARVGPLWVAASLGAEVTP